ncbi:hypothetical protein [Pseudoalteromonas phage KB12-38]|nr:hypothetical protein [Pseudoalteromonas phage KB12-38]
MTKQQLEQKLELFKELSLKFRRSAGAKVKHGNKTWTSGDYFSMLGELKKGFEALKLENFEINWLYEKYKSNIPQA